MTEEGWMRVRLGGMYLTVPIYRSKARTEEIAADLTEQLKAIEANSERIDTQAFALQLTFEYAVRAAKAEHSAEEETREMGRALERLLTALRGLAAAKGEDDDAPPSKEPEPPSNLTPFRA